jgi:hypothetical protein
VRAEGGEDVVTLVRFSGGVRARRASVKQHVCLGRLWRLAKDA